MDIIIFLKLYTLYSEKNLPHLRKGSFAISLSLLSFKDYLARLAPYLIKVGCWVSSGLSLHRLRIRVSVLDKIIHEMKNMSITFVSFQL